MAVTTADTIKLSDVCLEIYGSSNTAGKSLMGCHADATGTFDPNYNTQGASKTLLDFRGYAHTNTPTSNPATFLTITPTSATIPAEGGLVQISVTANGDWYVELSDNSWASFSGASGTGDDDFTVSISENTLASSRDLYVDVRSTDDAIERTCTITQAAAGMAEPV